MKRRRYLIILFLFVCAVACQNTKDPQLDVSGKYFAQIHDSYNRKIILAKEPQRIVSLSPGITENIFALGGGAKIVGRSNFCNYPEEAKTIEVVGDMLNVNVEKIISLNPDLVIMGSIVSRNVLDMLSRGNVPVIVITEKPFFSGIYDILNTLGMVLNRKAEAAQITASLKNELDSLMYLQKIPSKNKPSVYYVVGYGQGGEYTAGGNTYIHDILQLSGTRNIAEDVQGWSFSRELLFERNPEYIFIRKEDFENFCNSTPYKNLTAVKQKKVFPIESSWIDVQTPRGLNAIHYIVESVGNAKEI